MAYAAMVSTTTDEITQTWSGTTQSYDNLVAPSGYRKQALNDSEWASIKAAGRLTYPDGTHKWTYPSGGSLTFVSDPRYGLGFSTDTVEMLQGGSNSTTTVTIQVYDADDNPITPSNTIYLRTSEGKWIKLDFTNGEATLTISLALIRTFTIDGTGNPDYRFMPGLLVKIAGDNEI